MTPSMIYSGVVLAPPLPNEPFPRMMMLEDPPGLNDPFDINTPVARPCKASAAEPTFTFFSSSGLTEMIELVRSLFLAVPYPMATTSSSSIVDSCIITLMIDWLAILISCVCIPMREKVSVFPLLISMVYLPSRLVTVPCEVLLHTTDTPGRGFLSTSVTVPEILVCAINMLVNKHIKPN